MRSERLRQTLRGVDRRLPWTVRRVVRQSRRPEERRSPLVTVVVAAAGRDATWLGSCLDSLRAQTHRNLEIVVVPCDRHPPLLAAAHRHRAEDWRVRVVGEGGLDQAAARNAAAGRARGQYLCFVNPEDVVPPGGLRALVDSLERSGSDLAVGRSVQLPLTRSVESNVDPAHDADRHATTMQAFPMAVADTGIGNRLFRTSFWRRSGLAFPPAHDLSARSLAIEAFVVADLFDVLTAVTYQQVRRGAAVPFGTLVNSMDGLEDWLVAQRATWQTLDGVEATAVRDAWAYVVCDDWAIPFIDDTERATDEQWKSLRTFLAGVTEMMGPDLWARVRAECKVKVWLATQDRRSALEEFLSRRWFELGNRPTVVTDGQVRAVLPLGDEPDLGVPDSCCLMSEEETRLHGVVRSVRRAGAGLVDVDLFAYIDFVDQAGPAGESMVVEAFAVEAGTGRRTRLRVERRTDLDANLVVGHRYQDYSAGACTVRVDLRALGNGSGRRDVGDPAFLVDGSLIEWWVELRVVVQGVERVGPLTRLDPRGNAGLLFAPSFGARSLDGRRVQVRPDPHRGLRFVLLPAHPARLVEVAVDGRRLSGTVVGEGLQSLVVERADALRARAQLTSDGSDVHTFELRLPRGREREGELPPRVWRLHALAGDRTPLPVEFLAPDEDALWLGGSATSDVVVGRNGAGACEVVEAGRTVVLEHLDVGPDSVRIRGRWPGRVPVHFTVRLRNARFRLEAVSLTLDGPSFEAVVPLTYDEWSFGERHLPGGLYLVDVLLGTDEEQVPVRVVLARAVSESLLSSTDLSWGRLTTVYTGRDVGLRVAAPLADDERGPHAQKALQQWYQDGDPVLDDKAVYLQSYTGIAATDSQRAIHEELRRARPELTLYWGVAHPDTPLPEGAVPLLMQSREWYSVLARARYLCNNIDFERWFVKRPGQQFLQTFHGYPAKSMGIRLWSAKHFTDRRIELELERTSRDWDLILTPSPEMDVHYRVEYRYEGEIESRGYPRDDVLVSGGADQLRAEARERLDVAPHQTVVLYAPTWRDDLATSYRSAPLVRHLDLDSASERLGEDYVFLMRGHRFHARGARRSGSTARLIDVTDYPEVNDLILAADAAVLDYSSMRFDFALTGRPMLFLVPDLGDYTGGVRGFLYPFEDSAPGPLIQDAEEVVDRLRDLAGVQKEYAEAYADFNRRYNAHQDGRAAERVVERFFSPG